MTANEANINRRFGIISSIRYHSNNSLGIYVGFRRFEVF